MSYSMIVIGELKFPKNVKKEFEKLQINPSDRDDHLGNLSLHLISDIQTVADAIIKIPEYIGETSLRINFNDKELSIKGILQEDAFLDYAVYLVEMFREAASLAGNGELVFMEEQTIYAEQEKGYCYKISVNSNFSIHYMSLHDQRKYRKTELFQEISSELLGIEKEELKEMMDFKRLSKE